MGPAGTRPRPPDSGRPGPRGDVKSDGAVVGVAPRVFLKKLVGDVLDRVDQFPDFDPRRDYQLTIADNELTDVERNARRASSVDDIELQLD